MFLLIYTVDMNYTLCLIYFNIIYWISSHLLCIFILGYTKKDVGENFFNHFRKDFIRPYGLAHDESSFHPATLSCRLNNINWEFVLRTQIATWEFTETVPVNLKYVKENLEILDWNPINAFIKKTKKIEPYLNILNSKQKDKTGMCIS